MNMHRLGNTVWLMCTGNLLYKTWGSGNNTTNLKHTDQNIMTYMPIVQTGLLNIPKFWNFQITHTFHMNIHWHLKVSNDMLLCKYFNQFSLRDASTNKNSMLKFLTQQCTTQGKYRDPKWKQAFLLVQSYSKTRTNVLIYIFKSKSVTKYVQLCIVNSRYISIYVP